MKAAGPQTELAPSTQSGSCRTVFRDATRHSLARRSRILALLLPLIGFQLAISATAATFIVDSTGDASDAKPGSGICGTLPGVMRTDPDRGPCTLRAAIEEANAFAGADTIQFNIPASDPNCDASTGQCIVNLSQALPDISERISIAGPGANLLTVRRAPTQGNGFRIFNVTATGISPLSKFTRCNKGGGNAVSAVPRLREQAVSNPQNTGFAPAHFF